MHNVQIIKKITTEYQNRYNTKPLIVKAPGRINLIGEHTDYNEGFVMPAAINKAIYFAMEKRNDDKIILNSIDYNDHYETTLKNIKFPQKQWSKYLIGIHFLLKDKNIDKGYNCIFSGDIPLGAGMSSSAAIESGFIFSLNTLYNLNLNRLEMAKIGQKAEHKYVGVNCGIMDQFASLFGKKSKAIKLDCKNLNYEYVDLNFNAHTVLLCNTGVKHTLASSEYNKRRNECNEGVEFIKNKYNNINSLRDVTINMLDEFKNKLKPDIYKRCSYVIQENNRLQNASHHLNNNNLLSFGQEMYGSHYGLKDQYEVSCPELDFLVKNAQEFNGVIGSRMMGGGFGGCTINLIENSKLDQFKSFITSKYKNQYNIDCEIYEISAETGVEVIDISHSF